MGKFLYNSKIINLASAENKGFYFWKIGITNYNNKLKLSKGNYLECFRQKALDKSSAIEIYRAIYQNLKNLQNSCEADGYSLEKPLSGFSYDLPLYVLEEIFDFWIDIYTKPQYWNICFRLLNCHKENSFSNVFCRKALKGLTYKMNEKIDYLHSFRPTSQKAINSSYLPMW